LSLGSQVDPGRKDVVARLSLSYGSSSELQPSLRQKLGRPHGARLRGEGVDIIDNFYIGSPVALEW
jgi:hypothetical protein